MKTVLAIGAQAPLALAGPLVLMFAGGVMLQRNQRSSALIEAQLRRIAAAPSLRETRLSTVSVKSAAGLG